MTADHWLTGVGKDQFGKEFKLWYQPLQMKTRYAAALNNYLTLSAERGIFALFGYLVLITVPLWLVWRIVCHNDNAWIQSLLAGQFVFLISGLFTYSLTIWEVASFYWILWLFTAIYLIQKIWEKEFIITRMRIIPPILFSLVVCIFVLILGTYELNKIPTTVTPKKLREHSLLQISPRHLPSKATILFYPEASQNLEALSLQFLRPLAAQGYTIYTYLYDSANRSSLEKFSQINSAFIQSQTAPRFLIAHGSGGRLGFITGAQQQGFHSIILISPETRWPFTELSANEFASQANVPVLILHGDQDRVVNMEDSKAFYQELLKHQKQAELLILPETTHAISEKKILENVLTFLNRKTENTILPLR